MMKHIVGGERLEVPCTIDIEHSDESLHAYVELEGVAVEPGDEVLVHGGPIEVKPGDRVVLHRRATVTRGGWLGRVKAKIEGYFELTELYEVGFSEGRSS